MNYTRSILSAFLFLALGLVACSDYGDADESAYTQEGLDGQQQHFETNDNRDNYQSATGTPPQQDNQLRDNNAKKRYQEPTYRAFAFDYPASYQVLGAGLSEGSVMLPFVLLGNADRSTFLFINNPYMFNYVHFSRVNMRPGIFYMGAYVTNNISYAEHLNYVMTRNGIPSYQVERQEVVNENAQEQGKFTVAFRGNDGKVYRGIVFVVLNQSGGTPFVNPVDWGFFSAGNFMQAEKEFNVMVKSLYVNQEVARRLDQQRAQEINNIRMANRRNNQALARARSNQSRSAQNSSSSMTDESIRSSRRMADLIGDVTTRYDPYAGENRRLDQNYDSNYYTDSSGNVITNNTGEQPAGGYLEMPDVNE